MDGNSRELSGFGQRLLGVDGRGLVLGNGLRVALNTKHGRALYGSCSKDDNDDRVAFPWRSWARFPLREWERTWEAIVVDDVVTGEPESLLHD